MRGKKGKNWHVKSTLRRLDMFKSIFSFGLGVCIEDPLCSIIGVDPCSGVNLYLFCVKLLAFMSFFGFFGRTLPYNHHLKTNLDIEPKFFRIWLGIVVKTMYFSQNEIFFRERVVFRLSTLFLEHIE